LRDLCKICGEGTMSNWFNSRIKWELSDWTNVRFWDDKWDTKEIQKERFPKLYLISLYKDYTVGEVGDWNNNT